MRIKRIVAVLLTVLCVCINFSFSASAETLNRFIDSDISPAYEIAKILTSSLSIGNNTAYCTSKASGDDTVSITVEHTLQKYSGWLWIWNDVSNASWSKTSNTGSISLTNSKSGLDSGTYRLKSVFVLTNSSGKTETITINSQEKQI